MERSSPNDNELRSFLGGVVAAAKQVVNEETAATPDDAALHMFGAGWSSAVKFVEAALEAHSEALNG
jgi:hypothetical protein